MNDLEHVFGPWWPFVVLMLVGVLPNEIWRMAAALLARRVNERSEFFVLVRMVSTALVAAVVAKLLVQPPPALAAIPLWGRAGAVAIAITVFLLTGRSMLWAVLGGVGVTVLAAFFFSDPLSHTLR